MRGCLEFQGEMKMMLRKGAFGVLVIFATLILTVALEMESSAWAKGGDDGSSGSFVSRSFSAQSMQPGTAPSPAPGITPTPGPGSSGMGRSKSPFWSGFAGSVVAWFIGNLLFGGRAYAGPMGYGGGLGLLDLVIIGALIYFGYRYFVRRRGGQSIHYEENLRDNYRQHGAPHYGGSRQPYISELNEVERGLEEIRRFDPSFNTETYLETVEDLFFRVQAAWMNRSLDGVENMLTREMGDYFGGEFARMKHEHIINRLENIAVREVEPAEVWRESSRDFITVLITASLLDYTVDDKTGKLVKGDKLNPVKFQEFWTFTRDTGNRLWQLAGINQPGEPASN